jgi:hypothetical protein
MNIYGEDKDYKIFLLFFFYLYDIVVSIHIFFII